MGNHLIGKMFNAGVCDISENEIDQMTTSIALKILDDIGNEVIKSTSLDAEFDDLLNPNENLGRIIIRAFYPKKYEDWKNLKYVNDEICDEWWSKVKEPFSKRYGFW